MADNKKTQFVDADGKTVTVPDALANSLTANPELSAYMNLDGTEWYFNETTAAKNFDTKTSKGNYKRVNLKTA
jgi:hypothetical protein